MMDLDKGRRLARRRMAWASFVFLLSTAVTIVARLTLVPGATEVATALNLASGVLTALLTVFTTIVLAYLGVSVVESVFKKGD